MGKKCIMGACARRLTDDNNYNKFLMSYFWIFDAYDIIYILSVKFIVNFYFI